MKTRLIAAALAGTAFAGPASANLLLNPGFDNIFSPAWTQGNNMAVIPNYKHNGAYSMSVNCSGANSLTQNACSMRQSIATTVGQSYDISFWIFNSNVANNQFRVAFGTTNFGTMTYSVAQEWTEIKLTGVATGTTTLFQFWGRAIIGNLAFDDFVIDPTPVPEPAMLGLFGLGALSLGLARRRRA